MKFSTSIASVYIQSEPLRKNSANQHIILWEKVRENENKRLPDSIIERLTNAGLRDMYFNNPKPSQWTKEMRDIIWVDSDRVFMDMTGLKVFIIRKTVQDMCAKIKINEERKFDFLQKATDGNRMLVLDEKRFYKYYKTGGRIVAIYFDAGINQQTMFNFDLDRDYAPPAEGEFMADAQKQFIQLIMFMEFAPFEKVFLKPNQKDGTRSEGKVVNDTPQNLIVVDSAWNKIIVRTEGFKVGWDTGGFLALRACGTGRYDRRFVWINPFEKKGYVRGVNKEKAMAL